MKKFELALQVGLVPRSSDTGKDITLRNANEHKKLEGQLKELDLQLRSKLVNMQAEIMELKASPYGQMKPKKRSPRKIEIRERSKSDGRLPLTRENRTNPHGYIPLSRQGCLPLNNGQRDDQSLVLPEINPQKTSLVSNNSKGNICYNRAEAGKRRNKASMSSVDKVFLHVPSPPSLYRPSSLPDLSRLAVNGGSISTKSRGVKFFIPEVKVEQNKVNSTKDENQNQLMLQESKNRLDDRINDFVTKKNELKSETTNVETPVIEVSDADEDQDNVTKKDNDSHEGTTDVFYNSMLAKISMEDEEESKPDLASLGFMDFNEVIDKRLKQTQEKLPSEEEMRKIRYLRWRVEAPQLDLVETVFDNREDLDNVCDTDELFKSIT